MSEWRTAITKIAPNRIYVRGYSIEQIMENLTFADVVYLVLKGELPPSEGHRKVMNAFLCSIVDYGIGAPSVCAARYVASSLLPHETDVEPVATGAAVGAGLAAVGLYHGGAPGGAARWIQAGVNRMEAEGKTARVVAREIARKCKEDGVRLQGFGHPHHNIADPRTVKLREVVIRNNLHRKHWQLVEAMCDATEEVFGKRFVMNAGAALGATLSDLGFHWKLGYGLFAIGRCPGLVAHVFEEITRDKPFRVPSSQVIEYDGPPERDIPAGWLDVPCDA